MNFEFAEKINPYLEKLNFKKALEIAVNELQKIPNTDFHSIINISLIMQAEKVADWINEFYQNASKKSRVKAFFFGMNEFDINTDMWFIDGFSYSNDGGLNLDMDWLHDSDDYTDSMFFRIEQLEKLQVAFSEIEVKKENDEWTDELQEARDWCEQIIIAMFMELMREAHLVAKEKQYLWATLPIYFTECEYDFIVKSAND
jgi:hypothetical protein